MSHRKFLWSLRRLAKQKKDENEAIKKQQSKSTSGVSKGKKYLGLLK